jgi:ATP synthase protein I
MPSNDVRNLVHTAAPTAVAGVAAVAISGAVAGGKGALGAVIGIALAIFYMGIGLYVLQRTAKSLPHLFQAMGLMLYVAQLLLLMIFLALFKNTSAFNGRAFGFSLVAATIVWMAAQARAHMTSRIFYVDPDPAESGRREKTGSSS